MLGDFLRDLAQERLRRVESPSQLEPGTAIVAVAQAEQLRATGLPRRVRFGIVCSCYSVMCQNCVQDDIEKPVFRVEKVAAAEFFQEGNTVYAIEQSDVRDSSRVLVDAQSRYLTTIRELRSYPGDDFVAECMYGEDAQVICTRDKSAGQHWWTPLRMTLYECLKWIGIPVDSVPKSDFLQLTCFDQSHHGIAIEGGQVIHFSTKRVPDGSNRIKVDSQSSFRDITEGCNQGGPVAYENETDAARYNSRNRAVWVFCHADAWKSYNLLSNNCEHFSRYCRVGYCESRQVVASMLFAVGKALEVAPLSGKYKLMLKAASSLLSSVSKVYGQPQPQKAIEQNPEDDEDSLIEISYH